MNTKKKWLIPLGMWLVFEIVAVTLWLTKEFQLYRLGNSVRAVTFSVKL